MKDFAKSIRTENKKVGNEATGPNWDKKRQLEDELRGWMTMVNKLEGEEKQNAEKQISDIRKELNDVKIKIAHGENKKAGNESIDKQTWSMFKGLAKDAEKEVGNARLGKFLMEGGHTAELVEEGGKFIIKFDDGSTETFMTRKAADSYLKSHSELYIGNSKTGNETLAEYAKSKPRVINDEKSDKFGYVMREFKEGKLKSGSGETVTNPEQAKAIAYSESEKVDNLKRARNKMAK